MAKKAVEAQILNQRIRENKNAQRLIESIADITRQMDSLQKEINNKEDEIERLRTLGQDKFVVRENNIFSLAMVINQIGNNNPDGLQIEQIFLEENENVENRRRNLNDRVQALRFLYSKNILEPLRDFERVIVEEATPQWDREV